MFFTPEGTPMNLCDGCGRPNRVMDLVPTDVVVGRFTVTWDKRPRTPTGGRKGFPEFGRVNLAKTERQNLCPNCRGVAPKPEPRKPRLVKKPCDTATSAAKI